MKTKLVVLGIFVLLVISVVRMKAESGKTGDQHWAVHDMNRPQPAVVTAGEKCGDASSDAIILFNGRDMSGWLSNKTNEPAKWKVENGYMEVTPKAGDIHTQQAFGDCQLHIEWATPAKVDGSGQHPGNSGVFMMSTYEIQVLNSYNNITYADGVAGAVYGQNPPMVNSCRKPGEWQSYDIIFHAPKFDKDGNVVKKALVTVFWNGVLVQDNFEIWGATVHGKMAKYKAHADRMPLALQEHDGQPVRFRNIWVRELKD